jgi:hypothetical protein
MGTFAAPGQEQNARKQNLDSQVTAVGILNSLQ